MKAKLHYKVCLIFIFSLMLLHSDVHSTTYIINVANFSFSSPSLNVSVGDTMKWQYVSGNHTTTCNGSSGTSRPAGAPAWNSPINNTMTQFVYVVTVAGTYVYKCLFHGSMTGTFTAVSPVLNLNLTAMMEGLWNGTVMVSDTVKVFLHNSVSPFGKADSAKVKLNTSGNGALTFSNAPGGSYYIVVKHRNSIETWSKLPVTFTSGGTVTYNFTTSADKAFGDNETLKDGKYTFYSGDPDQNGSINLSDVLLIYNNGVDFVNGYVVTDLNGDNITDLIDLLIAQNNASKFVTILKPGM